MTLLSLLKEYFSLCFISSSHYGCHFLVIGVHFFLSVKKEKGFTNKTIFFIWAENSINKRGIVLLIDFHASLWLTNNRGKKVRDFTYKLSIQQLILSYMYFLPLS